MKKLNGWLTIIVLGTFFFLDSKNWFYSTDGIGVGMVGGKTFEAFNYYEPPLAVPRLYPTEVPSLRISPPAEEPILDYNDFGYEDDGHGWLEEYGE